MTGRTRKRLEELEAVVTTPCDLEAEIERARNVLKGKLELAPGEKLSVEAIRFVLNDPEFEDQPQGPSTTSSAILGELAEPASRKPWPLSALTTHAPQRPSEPPESGQLRIG
jgi:hypothetical protein